MENSQEEVFSGSSDGENIRLSKFSIYHSAQDLQDAVMEDVVLVPSEDSTPKAKSIMFSDGKRSVDFVLGWLEDYKNENATKDAKREAFENHLQEEGLEVEKEITDRLHIVKLHAPIEVLKRYCEILKVRMPMREIPGQEELFRTQYDTIMTEVKSFLARLLSCVRLDASVFPSQKFQLTAEYSRHKSYLFDEKHPNFFSSQIRTIVVDFILERTSFSLQTGSVSEVGIQKLINDGVYDAAYPLHDGKYDDPTCLRGLLLKEWAALKNWAMYQPIDQVRDYFGVKFALYFAWLGFYTHMLIPAALFGVLTFFYGIFTVHNDTYSNDICDESLNITMCPRCDEHCDYWKLSDTCTYAKFVYLFDNPATIIFAIFMSFWATLFLELWKRYSASIAHRWGLTDFSLQGEPPRPQYLAKLKSNKKTKMKKNLITGVQEPYVPFWTVRLPAMCLSFSVAFLLVMVAIAAVFGVVFYRMSVLASISLIAPSQSATHYAIVIIPSTAAVINLVFIFALNYIYNKIAVYMTEFEMLRTQTEFDESLTIKIYLFQFVNYYTSIMYIAFLKGKFVGYPAKYNRIFGFRQEECNPGGCLMELSIQLAIIMVGQQAMNSVIEMVLPYFYQWLNVSKIKAGQDKKLNDQIVDPTHKQWNEDFKLVDFGTEGLFNEYLEMVVQYGFVTIFVSAFPLAPFFALINNVFEMRLDAKKFLFYYRRPVPRRVPNIGVWYRILNVLGRLAVISNAFIIAFSSNFIPKMVYKYYVSPDHSDTGFLNHSLAVFNVSDFEFNSSPLHPTINATMCRYSAYRHSPDHYKPYKRSSLYWHILSARLLFVVVFQNIVSIVMIIVQWCIPDVSPKLQDQIKREHYLTTELIIQHEANRAKNMDQDKGASSKNMLQAEQGVVRRPARKKNKNTTFGEPV
ncbi:anoctamin-5 isoform X2 [Cimex lectularius]|uniref:Anoctamin n=1 Tax=Cimex lectularius TaxID=79782 RepID=A0A8I6RPX9_CIMLE|nr:anoctamin-5 isoform X2 [Cimex lectularius]